MSNYRVLVDGTKLAGKQILDKILEARGIEDVSDFLHPSPSYLIPYTYLQNIDKAKDIILSTIQSQGSFMIYADVDTDGCSSAAIAYRYLKNFTDKIKLYINKGKEHGIESFEYEKELQDIDTLIIVDSINDNVEYYNRILEKGVKLIVIDHHIPEPQILAIKDDICLVSSAVNYPNSELSGSGTTWKVMKYIDECSGTNYADDLVDLAATGIIADVCSVGKDSMENRYICDIGFRKLHNPGLKLAAGDYNFTSQTVGFSIAPLINAANRMEDNENALKLFTEDDLYDLSVTMKQLKFDKEQQIKKVDAIYSEILGQIEAQKDNKCLFFIVSEAHNLSGLLATRLVGEYNRPVIVVSVNSNDSTLYSGSIRAVGVSDFRQMVNDTGLAYCRGHENSAGINIPINNYNDFVSAILKSFEDIELNFDSIADVELLEEQITPYFADTIQVFNRISGKNFREISVKVSDISSYNVGSMSNGKHLNIKTFYLSLIKWNCSDATKIPSNKKLTVIGVPQTNTFKGNTTTQLILSDYMISELFEPLPDFTNEEVKDELYNQLPNYSMMVGSKLYRTSNRYGEIDF